MGISAHNSRCNHTESDCSSPVVLRHCEAHRLQFSHHDFPKNGLGRTHVAQQEQNLLLQH